MQKRKNKKSQTARKASCRSANSRSASNKNQCRALILLNSTVVRKKYITLCKRAQTNYHKTKQELDVYEKQDKPAFDQWIHGQLGAELTTLRELQQKYKEKHVLYNRIVIESRLTDRSMSECYKRIKNGESGLKERYKKMFAEGTYKDYDSLTEEELSDIDDGFRQIYESFMHFFSFGDGDNDYNKESRGQDDCRPATSKANANKERTLKSLYRDICRRLHPDAEGTDTAEELEIWHQVQAAYQQGDTDRLEFLRAKTDFTQNGIDLSTPISHIQQITEEYKEARASLRNLIRRARRDAAWGFCQWPKEKVNNILKAYRFQLNEENDTLQGQLKEIEDFLEELEMHARKEEEREKAIGKSKSYTQGANKFRSASGRQGQRPPNQRKGNGRKQTTPDPNQIEFDFI